MAITKQENLAELQRMVQSIQIQRAGEDALKHINEVPDNDVLFVLAYIVARTVKEPTDLEVVCKSIAGIAEIMHHIYQLKERSRGN